MYAGFDLSYASFDLLPSVKMVLFGRKDGDYMSENLTRDADKILCTLYGEYLNRRKDGSSKEDAAAFNPSQDIQDELFPDTPLDDLNDALSELNKAGFIKMNITDSFELQKSAIIDLEGRFKKGLIEVTDFISKFIP